MSVLTLQELIEEHDARVVACQVIIAGQLLPKWTSVNYSFAIGQVPTATIIVPGRTNLPSSVAEEASVEIWFGFRVGMATLYKLVFGGAVVDSVGNNGHEVVIDCVMDGARKLSYSYNRTIDFEFDNVTAEEAVTELFSLAGVINYALNLDPWLIGTAVPQDIEFSTYGEAINKVAEVDGSPWYCMPTGQIRVENRDPVPSPSARRTYFSGVLTGSIESQPVEITNPEARPRIIDLQRRKFRGEVANFITVNGAVVVTVGPLGETNSEQIVETVDGLSGQFPNGAYWIPTPPLFQHFIFSNELIDTNAKAFEVAERYFDLKNRLFEEIPLSIPGDPDVFLGETIEVVDPNYTGVSSLYFVKGYRTEITQNACATELQLTGGDEAGTTGYAAPFAEFFWKYQAIHDLIMGPPIPGINLGSNTDLAAKLCQDVPEDTGDSEQGGGFGPGEDKRTVIIGLDGTASADFDGYIISYEWEWTDDADVVHSFSGPRWTLIIDPDVQSSVEVTLTVTDNSGRTDSITKTIYTSASYIPVNGVDPANDPTLDDTSQGGGAAEGPCTEEEVPEDAVPPTGKTPTDSPRPTQPAGQCAGMMLYYFVAASAYAMGTKDNRTWNDLTKAAAGVTGNFISVAAGVNSKNQQPSAIFGTDAGEIVRSDDTCATGTLVLSVAGAPRIECIHFDTQTIGETGGGGDNSIAGDVPIYTQGSPGTLTTLQAFKQALAVGFTPTSAIIAVAVMTAESSLRSDASNTTGNIPPSTDRGIVQINSYYHPEVSDADAYNTALAIRHMYRISSGGSDFTPWSAFNARTYTRYLAGVQQAVGNFDISNTTNLSNVLVPGMKVWAGTSDGRIFLSNDSGRTWTLFHDFHDGYPIKGLATPPRFGAETDSLWVFGGDTADRNTLVRIDPAKSGNFVPLVIAGDLARAITTAGPGFTCNSSLNQTATLLSFNGGVNPSVWTSNNPILDPESWTPSEDISGSIDSQAPGHDGIFVVAGNSGTYKTVDNEDFDLQNASPATLNQIAWQGLPGLYLAAGDSGFYNTVDFGVGWGFMRPNATFSTTWPAGAIGYQLAFSIGPRPCPSNEGSTYPCLPGAGLYGDGAINAPFSEAANAVTSITVAAGIQVDAIPSVFLLPVYSDRAAGQIPSEPTISDEFNLKWKLIKTILFNGDRCRLSLFAADITQALIDDGNTNILVQFKEAQAHAIAFSDQTYGGSLEAIGQTAANIATATELRTPLAVPTIEGSFLYTVAAIFDETVPLSTLVKETGYTELLVQGGDLTGSSLGSAVKASPTVGTTSVKWDVTPAVPGAVIAIEISPTCNSFVVGDEMTAYNGVIYTANYDSYALIAPLPGDPPIGSTTVRINTYDATTFERTGYFDLDYGALGFPGPTFNPGGMAQNKTNGNIIVGWTSNDSPTQTYFIQVTSLGAAVNNWIYIPGSTQYVLGITYDNTGNIWAIIARSVEGQDELFKFSAAGTFILSHPAEGPNNAGWNIASDGSDNIYYPNNLSLAELWKASSTGISITSELFTGSDQVGSMTVDTVNSHLYAAIYIASGNSWEIRKYDLSLNYISTIISWSSAEIFQPIKIDMLDGDLIMLGSSASSSTSRQLRRYTTAGVLVNKSH